MTNNCSNLKASPTVVINMHRAKKEKKKVSNNKCQL